MANIKFNSNDIKKLVLDKARDEVTKKTYNIKCPHCQREITAKQGKSICKYCNKEVTLKLDINF